LTPDSAHYAGVARNLLRGDGYTLDVVPYHTDPSRSVRHVPEMHGLLRPFALVPLFGALGLESSLVRVPGFVYLALTGLVAFAFARRLFGAGAGLLACGFVLASPRLTQLAWSGLDDAGFACLFLLFLAAFHRALVERRTLLFAVAGALAGVALLEKLIGVFVAGLLVTLPLCARDVPRARWLRWAGAFLVTFALFPAAYLVRNFAASGSPMFGFSAIEWIWKAEGYYGAFKLYDAPPRLGPLLASLGWERVLGLVGEQFGHMRVVFFGLSTPAWLVPLGIASLLVQLRGQREFAVLGLLSLFGSTVFVCVAYHVEPRYFAFWLPLLGVSLAGALAEAVRGVGQGRTRRATRAAGLAAAIGCVVATSLVSAREIRSVLHIQRPFRDGGVCFDAVAFGREQMGRDQRVLAQGPWRLHWDLDRPTVMVPAGGAPALATVARRYDTRWLVTQPRWSPGEGRIGAEVARFVARPPRGWQVEPVFEGRSCDVYRLRWPGAAARGSAS
jgi:hypothetical protein